MARLFYQDVGARRSGTASMAGGEGERLRVKVGFEDRGKHYRTELHFPYPDDQDGALVLSYADRGWNKDVAQRFQDLVKREVNAEIHPKRLNPSKRRRDSERTKKPRKKGSEYWAAVLQTVTDDPADWILEERQRLAKSGLITLRNEVVFRCGDPLIPLKLRPDHTPECTGEIVMPFAPVNPAAPFEQEPGAEYPCSSCGHRWRVDTFKPPAIHRTYVDIGQEAAWAKVQELLQSWRPPFEEEEPGVWSRKGSQGREYVVNPATAQPAWLEIGRGRYSPMCWFVPEDSERGRFGDQSVTLVDVLAKKKKAVSDVLKTWSRPSSDANVVGPVLASGSAATQTTHDSRPPVASPGSSDLSVRLIQPGEAGLYLDTQVFCKEGHQRTFLMFALLDAIHAQHNEKAARSTERQYHSARQIAELDPSGQLEEQDIHTWVNRVRRELDDAFPGTSMGWAVIESGGRRGIRLGKSFEVRGISLQAELDVYKASR